MTTDKYRYIIIDEDTLVGYNYIKKQFYVTNKGTTTYRTTVDDTLQVLTVLNVGDQVTSQQLQDLQDNYETLQDVFYTWQDNGAYIKTLQFNDFIDYPLTLECEKGKLYIKNSTIIYDLTTNESPSVVRIPYLCSFYANTLGLNISLEDMTVFYNLLLSYYSPTCYNQITTPDKDTDPLKYNGVIVLSNYNNTSPAVYHCISNPLNKEIYSSTTYHISEVDTNNNTITIVETPTDINIGDMIEVTGTDVTIAETKYNSDGTYKVSNIQDNIITVAEPLSTSYVFPYIQCSVAASYSPIKAISRDNNTIIVEEALPNIVIGDTINIEGSSLTTTYEIISCDGEYTVSDISSETVTDNGTTTVTTTITVEEQLNTDITTGVTGNTTGYILKKIFIGNILEVSDKTLTLDRSIMLKGETATITDNTPIAIYNPTSNTDSIYHADGNNTGTTLILKETIQDIPQSYPTYPTVQKLEIPTTISINVTSVEEEYANIFPLGEFILDNFSQLQDYTELLSGLVSPTDTNNLNMYSTVSNTMSIGTYTATCKGLYSQIYET